MTATSPKKGRPTPKRRVARQPVEITTVVPRVPKDWAARIKREDRERANERNRIREEERARRQAIIEKRLAEDAAREAAAKAVSP